MTIHLDPHYHEHLLERFLRYVRVDTQSDENSTTSPSTEKQKDLARMLEAELRELGCADARMDQWGYVFATVPPRPAVLGDTVPTIGFLAHMDTSPATSGAGVKPQVVNYAGGDIVLPGNPTLVLREAEEPNLVRCLGHRIVTSDGTTLLGADDKAGIAEIMTVVEWLRDHPEFPHGGLRIAFTTDEEVGRGTEHFDVESFGARYAYTFDGSDLGEIEDETFCADLALVTLTGAEVHPGYAKGKMVNAVRGASLLVSRLPVDRLPETTEGRQPYLHPYDLKGDVTKAEIKVLVRAFSEEELRDREETLRLVAAEVERTLPGLQVEVQVKEQYRNMRYVLEQHPEVLECALEAARRQGVEPVRKAIRGGTDGSRLTLMGLPTPNLWAGGQNFHSPKEWVSLEWMAAAVELGIQLLAVWRESTPR
ncbi:MAG TPA: peptidase T [Myxococcota bacterium]|nr:peptidase T [Myxococcota bacterium]HQK52045.1 peptidase T [Myxococcota bacterium]